MLDRDRLNLSMFKAYDIRTPAEELPLHLSERLAYANAYYFREVLCTNKIVLCRDARLSGAQYLEQATEIFKSLGFQVYLYPLVSSTSMFYFSCMQHMDAAGIMYGASHNPGKDTGQKIIGPGLIPIAMDCGPCGGLSKIKEFYIDNKICSKFAIGKIQVINYLEDYVNYSMRLADIKPSDLKGLNIVLDFLSGAAGYEFLYAFDIAGANVVARNIIPDGLFPAGAPNPVIKESIKPTLDLLKNGNYLFAICFDGDGDRIDFLNNEGQQLNPGFNAALIGFELKRLFENSFGNSYLPQFYFDLKANPFAVIELAKKGFEIHLIRNGHSQIKKSLKDNFKNQFIGAVEESAHYYLNFPLNIDDSSKGYAATENTLFYGLLTAKTWLNKSSEYEDAFKIQNRTYREREWGYIFPDNDSRQCAMQEIEQEFIKKGGASMKTMDDGTELQATIIRENLPFIINTSTPITKDWTQICQRISQSEEGLARWEVLAGTETRKEDAVEIIKKVVKKYTDSEIYVG